MDPYFSYRFKIVITGIIEGGFTELSGLQITTQTEDFREGGVNDFVHKLPKETTFNNLVLKKGLGDLTTLWMWHRSVVTGVFKRMPVTIFMFKDRSDSIAHTWSFKDAYPVKWSGPDFKADGSTVAFETLELAHHGYAVG